MLRLILFVGCDVMLVASLQTPRAEEVEAKQQQQLGCLMSGSRQIKLNLRRAEEIRTLDFEVEFMRIKPSPRDFPPTLRKVLGV